jgi:hypothetical protein
MASPLTFRAVTEPLVFSTVRSPVDALRQNAAETRFRERVPADVGERDASVAGDRANTLRDVRGFDGAKRRLGQRATRACLNKSFIFFKFMQDPLSGTKRWRGLQALTDFSLDLPFPIDYHNA